MLDHLVLATPDLAATTESYRAAGYAPVEGGPHVGVGTRNALVGLGTGRYLELVGPDPEQPEPGSPRPFGIDGLAAERLVTWAVRVPDLDSGLEAVRACGHDPGPARAMSRRRPDGELLSWRLAFPPDDRGGVVPFLIDWGATTHPSESLSADDPLARLEIATPDAELVRAVLEATGSLDLVAVRQADGPSLRAVLDSGAELT